MYYKFNEEMINRKYTIKLCSLEKKYIYYRDNFKRLCIDNYKLQKENEELKEQLELTRRDNAIISNKIEENVEKNYISKDKIRTKIKELEDKCEAIKKEYTGTYALTGNYLEAFYQIVILKELLGETKDEE